MKLSVLSLSFTLVILSIIASIIFIIGLLLNKPNPYNIIYKDRIIYKDQIIYKDSTPKIITPFIYKDRLIYKNRPNLNNYSKNMRYGISFVGANLYSNTDNFQVGLGFKFSYQNYFSLSEVLLDGSLLFSIGRDF